MIKYYIHQVLTEYYKNICGIKKSLKNGKYRNRNLKFCKLPGG